MFFKHKWFDKKIPSGFSADSLCGSCENIYTLDSPVLKSPDSNTKNTHNILNNPLNDSQNDLKKITSKTSDESSDISNASKHECDSEYTEEEIEEIISDKNIYETNNREIPQEEVAETHINNADDDFDIINKDDIKPCDYNTYNEEETNGYMKILSNSIYNSVYSMLWKK
jgi:hypothetical protein